MKKLTKNQSRIRKLEKENERLRDALVETLLPLHITYAYYGRPSLKAEATSQAKKALKKVQEALDYEFWEMADITNTDEDDWEEFEERLDAWLGALNDEDDGDD